MTTYCADRLLSPPVRAQRVTRFLAVAVLCSVPAFAQPDAAPRELRERIEARYDVLATRDAVSLRPKENDTGIRWIEVTDDAITIDGRPVTGAELRTTLGDEADWILRLSYLDADDRRDLFEDIERSRSSRRIGGRLEIGDSVTVDADETIARDVVAIGGSARIQGEVRGTVVAVGGDVELGPTAFVNRDVVVIGGTLRRAPGARIGGEIHEIGWRGFNIGDWSERRAFGDFWPGPLLGAVVGLTSTLGRLAILSLFALLVVLLGREYVDVVGSRAAAEPLKAGAVGVLSQLLFLPLLVITIVMLVVTIIGIPLLALIPFVLLGLMIVGLVGFTAVAQRIGRLVAGRFGWAAGPYGTTFTGIVVVLSPVLVARLAGLAGGPTFGLGFAGAIFEYLVWTVGFGAVAISWLGGRRPASPPGGYRPPSPDAGYGQPAPAGGAG